MYVFSIVSTCSLPFMVNKDYQMLLVSIFFENGKIRDIGLRDVRVYSEYYSYLAVNFITVTSL